MTIRPFNNWRLKLLSLLSAVVLWFFVVGIENTVYVFPESFRIKAHNLGTGVSLATALPEVKLYVNTGGKDIKSADKNDFEAFVDLSGLGEGSHELPVMASSGNAQVSVLKADPETVNILLAPVAVKEVPVMISAKGSPSAGYEVKEFTAEPARVKITAARNILDKIDGLKAEFVLGGTETADQTRNLDLSIPLDLELPAESVRIEPIQVTATAVVIPAVIEKNLKINPVLGGGGDLDAVRKQLIVTPPYVTVRGEQNLLEGLTKIDTDMIDAGSLQDRTVPLAVTFELPAGVELADPRTQVTVKTATEKF